MEIIIKTRTVKCIEEQVLLWKNQHGFLLESFEKVNNQVDKNGMVDKICLGFQTAFDDVSHQKLWTNLRGHWIKVYTLVWSANG